MNRILFWLLIAFLASYCWFSQAQADGVHVEIGAGQAVYGLQPVGTWYQPPFDHEIDNEAATLSIGTSWEVNEYLRAGVRGIWFGRTSHTALAVPDDANYNPAAASGCNGPCLPKALLKGSGHAYGFAFTMQPGVTFGRHRWYFEVDAVRYYAKYKVEVFGDCKGWDENNVCTGGTQDYVQDRMKGHRWGLMFGPGYEYNKRVGVRLLVMPSFVEKGYKGRDEQGAVRNDPGIHKGVAMLEAVASF